MRPGDISAARGHAAAQRLADAPEEEAFQPGLHYFVTMV